MEKVWIVSLLLSSLVGGGAVAGSVAMDGNMSPEYMMHDDIVGDMTLDQDEACGMNGENYRQQNMQGEQNGDLTRNRYQNQTDECQEYKWQYKYEDGENGENNRYKNEYGEKNEEHKELGKTKRLGCCNGP